MAFRQRTVPGLLAVLLSVLYLEAYASDPATPGNAVGFWLGWWGSWDQSNYLRSAQAFAAGRLDPSLHWYPLGYALIGAPFVKGSIGHAYLLPDLALLLASYAAFLSFAGRVGVGRVVAALLFLLGTMGAVALRESWAQPWNTTASSALIWSMLALAARVLDGRPAGGGRASALAALGWVAAAIPFVRPTDLMLVAIVLGGTGLVLLRRRDLGGRDVGFLMLGALLAGVPEALLWLAIYGPHQSGYMVAARQLGFSLRGLWWKTYLLLLVPRPWFPYGGGLLERLPWMVPGLAAMLALPWIARGTAGAGLALLAVCIVAYDLLFFSYVDLLPSGLWLYHNVHYFKWTMPGMTLLGFVLLRALATGPRRPAVLALAAVILLSGVRLMPRPAGADAPAWMVQLPAPTPDSAHSYFAHYALHDDLGALRPMIDYRALPDSQGWRVIALRRAFEGPLVGAAGDPWWQALRRPTLRWRIGLSYGLPCWLASCSWHRP